MPELNPLPVPAPPWSDCRLLVESVEDYGIFMLDAAGRVTTWNRGAQKINGYTGAEILGKHCSAFYPAEDVAAGKPEAQLQLAAERGRFEDEGWRLRKDGSRFWAHVVTTPLFDDSGRLRGFAKVVQDVTDRRRAEEELRGSEERLRLLIEAVGDYAIFMLDPEGRVTTWNTGAEKLKGYRADEIIGKHFEVFFPEPARREGKPAQELELAQRTGRFEDEAFRVRKDGSSFWANIVITAIRSERGELLGYAKVTRDLTERIKAEETARNLFREQAARAALEENEARLREAAAVAEAAARRAEEASRVKDEFLATVSHELRTPLSAILGWASVLRDRVSEPSTRKGIEVIHRNALAQTKIVDDILDVSRIVTGKLRLELKEADFEVIVRDAMEVVAPSAAAKRHTLRFSAVHGPYTFVGDPVRMQQVVWNLLSNAVKFTEPGGAISVELERRGSALVLTVSDTGRGIEPSFLPYVFNRFTQADGSITRKVGGLGLGLSIVRHIIDLHGGEVRATSDGPGCGASFTVSLPVRAVVPNEVVASGAQPASEQASKEPSLRLDGIRVLTVDDDPDARDLLEEIMRQNGCIVATAGSASEAQQLLRDFKPDVLISDIGMPDEDGYALMRKVRALPSGEGGCIPSIALTAYAHPADRDAALAAGFTAHMAKPVRASELLLVVHNLVRIARP